MSGARPRSLPDTNGTSVRTKKRDGSRRSASFSKTKSSPRRSPIILRKITKLNKNSPNCKFGKPFSLSSLHWANLFTLERKREIMKKTKCTLSMRSWERMVSYSSGASSTKTTTIRSRDSSQSPLLEDSGLVY